MKKLLCCILFFIPVSLFPQSKTEKIVLDKDESVFETMYLPKAGLVISTGKLGYMRKNVTNLRFYSQDLEKIWDIDVDYKFNYLTEWNFLVGSADGSYVYFLAKGNLGKIDKTGKVATKELPDLKDQQAAFSSSNFLYILSVNSPTKKLPGKIVLHRFSAIDLAYKEIVITQLPEVKELETYTFWSYIGNSNDTIYLQSKFVDKKNRINKYQIAMIGSDGEMIDLIDIDCTLPEFTLPSRSYELLEGAALFTNYDLISGGAGSPSNVSVTPGPGLGAFGHIRIDTKNRAIYAYTFSGPKLSWLFGKTYEKLNFFKFDLNGKLIWKTSTSMIDTFIEKDFRSSSPMDGLLSFRANPDGTSILQVFYHKVYTFELSPGGEITQKYSDENEVMVFSYLTDLHRYPFEGQLAFPDQSDDGAYSFINSSHSGKPEFFYILYRFLNSDIVFEFEPTKNIANLPKNIVNLHLLEK